MSRILLITVAIHLTPPPRAVGRHRFAIGLNFTELWNGAGGRECL
jgi:hypothetical protein